jgi:hypothetical protein
MNNINIYIMEGSKNDKIFEYTTTFNSILKRLIGFSSEKSLLLKTNRIKGKISLLITNAPLVVMETAGPYLLKYAEHIKAYDEKFFLSTDFSVNFKPDLDKKSVNDFKILINQVRGIYTKCDSREKKYLNELCDDLLIAYCSYLHYNNTGE